MKKKSVKGLGLKKNSISKLNDLSKVTGGSARDICYSISACAMETCTFTCGNCIQTFGDPEPGCITGIPYICDMR
jgi:hypothetical protein